MTRTISWAAHCFNVVEFIHIEAREVHQLVLNYQVTNPDVMSLFIRVDNLALGTSFRPSICVPLKLNV